MSVRVGRRDIKKYSYQHKPNGTFIPSSLTEQVLAAHHQHYTWAEYQALVGASDWLTDDMPQDSKSDVIARYRVMTLMKNVQTDMSIPKPRKGK